MTPERWNRIQVVFAELADLPAAEQAERLARTCARDPELRHVVEDLLAADRVARDGRFIRRAIDDAARALLISRDRLGNSDTDAPRAPR